MRKIGQFLLANDLHAGFAGLLFALLAYFNLPGGFIASIIVGFVTLHKGYKSGLFVVAWAALPAISLLVLKRYGLFDFLLLRCFLVWVFAILLRAYGSWRLVLASITVLGALAVISVHFFIPNTAAWWSSILTNYIKEFTELGVWKANPAETKEIITRIAPIATGLLSFLVLISVFVELLLARWWQSAIFQPGRLQEEFLSIHLGKIAALVMTGVLILIVLKIRIGQDFLPIALLPFMITGLSLLHLTVVKNKMMFIPAILVYIGLVFIPFFLVPLLAFAGYIDSWINFRKNLAFRKKH